MMYIQITWDCDQSIDRFPLSKKSEEIYNEQGIEALLDHLYPKFGNIDNHSSWFVGEDLPEIRIHKHKV